MRVLPAMPVQAAIAVCAPMDTLCPIWIWLSRRTPLFNHRIAQRAPVDGGIGADLHVIADQHAAQLGHL